MSVPTTRTPRSPFMRSARSSAAVPGAPEAVTRTVMSRIAAAMLVRRGDRAGEEEADPVPAGDLAAVLPAEMRVDEATPEAARDERLLRPSVDLRTGRCPRRRRERSLQHRELPARRGAVRQSAAGRCAAQRVGPLRGAALPVRPDRDVQGNG